MVFHHPEGVTTKLGCTSQQILQGFLPSQSRTAQCKILV